MVRLGNVIVVLQRARMENRAEAVGSRGRIITTDSHAKEAQTESWWLSVDRRVRLRRWHAGGLTLMRLTLVDRVGPINGEIRDMPPDRQWGIIPLSHHIPFVYDKGRSRRPYD